MEQRWSLYNISTSLYPNNIVIKIENVIVINSFSTIPKYHNNV